MDPFKTTHVSVNIGVYFLYYSKHTYFWMAADSIGYSFYYDYKPIPLNRIFHENILPQVHDLLDSGQKDLVETMIMEITDKQKFELIHLP